MPSGTLLLAAGVQVVAAVLYGTLGARLAGQRLAGEDKVAMRLFALWWICLAATSASGMVLSVSAAFGWANFPLFMALTQFTITTICVGLAGLLYYLVYVYTGRSRYLWYVVAFYIVFYIVLEFYILASNPDHVIVGRWATSIGYEHPFAGPYYLLVVLGLLGPQVGAAFALLMLYRRLESRAQKYRVVIVSVSMLVWFGTSTIASLAKVTQSDAYHFFSLFLGIAAAAMILLAYFPPRMVQERWGITPPGSGPVEPSGRATGLR